MKSNFFLLKLHFDENVKSSVNVSSIWYIDTFMCYAQLLYKWRCQQIRNVHRTFVCVAVFMWI